MKILDIAHRYFSEQESELLFKFVGREPSAAFNLLMVCKDTELEELHGDELRTMMQQLFSRDTSYPELSDSKYKAFLNDLNNEVAIVWSNVRHKWVS